MLPVSVSWLSLGRRKPRPAIHHPSPACPSIAVFDSRFAPDGPLHVFASPADDSWRKCASAAGPVPLLLLLAQLGWRPEYALIALTSLEAPLEESDRETLWAAFGVPVYEQIFDLEGVLVAEECEAHDGLHLVGQFDRNGHGWVLQEGVCPCGRFGARLWPGEKSRAASAGFSEPMLS